MKHTLPFPSAVIWDMDGVISDTQKFHAQVESQMLAQHGISFAPEAITARYAGVSDEVMFAEIFAEHQKPLPDLPVLLSEKWELMRTVAQGKITAIPHAVWLVQFFAQHNLPQAIASASTLSFIQDVTEALGLQKYFSAVVSAQEVAHGKPAPDVFLLAAQRLGANPAGCLVIEDGTSGMKGAKAAGMRCIGLVEDVQKSTPADLNVVSLQDVPRLLKTK